MLQRQGVNTRSRLRLLTIARAIWRAISTPVFIASASSVFQIAAAKADIGELAVGEPSELVEIGAIAPPGGNPLQNNYRKHGDPFLS